MLNGGVLHDGVLHDGVSNTTCRTVSHFSNVINSPINKIIHPFNVAT